jgi:hypothetical protein
MDKNSRVNRFTHMPLKVRTFKTLSRLMTDEELAVSIAAFGGHRYLKPKEFIAAMRPRRIARRILLALACVTATQVAMTILAMVSHTSSPTMIMYSVGLSLWMIPAVVFAHAEHKNNIRKGRVLSRVYWLAEFRNYRYIGQVQQECFRPYFNMEEPDVTKYECLED